MLTEVGRTTVRRRVAGLLGRLMSAGGLPRLVDNSGVLTPYVPSPLDVASGSVAESMYTSNVYALSANAVGSAVFSAPGGNLDHYAIGSDGKLTAVHTTSLTASRPTAIAIAVQ